METVGIGDYWDSIHFFISSYCLITFYSCESRTFLSFLAGLLVDEDILHSVDVLEVQIENSNL